MNAPVAHLRRVIAVVSVETEAHTVIAMERATLWLRKKTGNTTSGIASVLLGIEPNMGYRSITKLRGRFLSFRGENAGGDGDDRMTG